MFKCFAIYKNMTKTEIFIFVILLVCAMFFIGKQLDKPLVFDEVGYLFSSRAINNTGVPVYYFGEERLNGFECSGKFFSGPFGDYFHTLLHHYILSYYVRFLGEANYVYRSFGAICFLLTVLFAFLTAKRLFDCHTAVFTMFLLLASPLFIQGALWVDINSSLMPAIAIFTYVFIKGDKRQYEILFCRHNLLLIFIIIVIVWIKEITFPLIVCSMFICYWLDTKNIKTAMRTTLFIGSISFALFFISWSIFCHLTGMSIGRPFYITFLMFLHRSETSGLIERLRAVKWDIFWFLPSFVILGLAAMARRVYLWLKHRAVKKEDFLIIISGITIFVYSFILINPSPKYKIMILPMLAIIIAALVCELFKGLSKREIFYGAVVTGILFVYYGFFFKNDIFLTLWSRTRVSGLRYIFDFSNPKVRLMFFYPLPLLILPPVLKFVMKKYSFMPVFILSAVLVYFPSALIQDYRQANGDYPTMYLYGEKGFRETVDYLQPLSNSDSLFICRKDIAAYLKVKFYLDYILLEPQKFERLLDSRNVEFIVFSDTGQYLPNIETERILTQRCEFVKKIGDFNIYIPNRTAISSMSMTK